MTKLTATADQANGSVLLDITKTATVARVLRHDANGTVEVRPMVGQLPSAGKGRLLLTDYEAAAGRNTYTVDDGAAGATATVTLDIAEPWLMVPIMPHYARQVEAVTDYSAGRESRGTVHHVPGRSDPLVSITPLSMRTGTIELYARTLAQAQTLESVFSRGEVVMLKQRVPGMDMYFTARSTSVQPRDAAGEELTRWRLRVDYDEVARPQGPQAGALGWTYAALAAAHASYAAVDAAYATYNDLTIQNQAAGV